MNDQPACKHCGQDEQFTADYAGYYWDAIVPKGEELAGEPLACPFCHIN